MTQTASGALLISALRALPKNAMSRLAGRFVSLRLPQPLQRWQILLAAWWFGINLGEVRDPLESFACFQDFFVRALRPGVRPLAQDPNAIASPCDGAWGEAGVVEDGQLVQVKGQDYSLGALLGSDADAKRFEGGSFATLYLSPADYHRFHAPCDVKISKARYLEGTLWPVNGAGLAGIDGLFAQNERVAAFMDLTGRGIFDGVCVVAVGATMVGKVKVEFDSLTTNVKGAPSELRAYSDSPDGGRAPRFSAGAEWGRFEFGSTLVVLISGDSGELDIQPVGTKVKMGARIGTLRGITA